NPQCLDITCIRRFIDLDLLLYKKGCFSLRLLARVVLRVDVIDDRWSDRARLKDRLLLEKGEVRHAWGHCEKRAGRQSLRLSRIRSFSHSQIHRPGNQSDDFLGRMGMRRDAISLWHL